jgi:membrane-associated phospholipid phosphatase
LALVIVTVTVAACGGSTSAPSTSTTTVPIDASQIWSRRWVEEVEGFVRADKPGPPAAARLYAYTAASYADAVSASDGGPQANEVTRQVVRALLPKHAAEIDTFAATLAARVTVAKPLQDLAAQYVGRISTDGSAADNPDAAMATEPAGSGHWVRVGGAGPANPSAGSWTRWILPTGTTFTVPPPPEYGSTAYEDQKRIVADYARRRDAVWQAKILRWGGAPGTNGPSGIWLDLFWTVSGPSYRSDAEFASAQSVLARTLADAFIECWKVKFVYWTARPTMVIPGLQTAMNNPPFPGYVSGHSTISAAAATVLGKLVPGRAAEWMRDAEEARDTRLYAGIHFQVDNTEGFALGEAVGTKIAQTLGL